MLLQVRACKATTLHACTLRLLPLLLLEIIKIKLYFNFLQLKCCAAADAGMQGYNLACLPSSAAAVVAAAAAAAAAAPAAEG